MGGNLPLGYDLQDRQLVINDKEAEAVRYVYQQYLELGSVSSLQAELRWQNIVSQALLQGRADEAGSVRRVSAEAIESIVERRLYEALPPQQQKAWSKSSTDQKRVRLRQLVECVVIGRGSVEIKVTDAGRETLAEASTGSLSIATALKAGVGGKQVVSRHAAPLRVDHSVVKAIV